MADGAPKTLGSTPTLAERLSGLRGFVVPIGFVSLLSLIIIPLPTFIIDLLLAVNISCAAIVLLTTVYMTRPLDFAVFPALLLATTLFRLALNIATTRMILTADASSAQEASAVAGKVIEAFGEFVAGNNPIVGTVIFIILVVVQFVVITKGSTRISEVAARFTLDAMPGKQMAIDADLTAGLIDESQARQRREEVMREADFYGAMDGASKFVRGDAIAGIIITVINILGGFAVGALYKGWSPLESLEVFTRLTIGDGLVSQVPSFMIAIAAGLIVARSSSEEDLGTDLTRQLTSQPRALFVTAGFLALMAFTGMPMFPMLGCAVTIAGVGYVVKQGLRQAQVDKRAKEEAQAPPPAAASVDDLLKVDLLELEVGYGLVQLVNTADGGDLLDRISAIRKQLASESGFVLPPVRIRDNSQLDQHGYRIKIRGAAVAQGTTYPKKWMAMDAGLASGPIEGTPTKEPAFGLEAWWIEDHLKPRAESLAYTVVDATSVLVTHFTEVIKEFADELLTREEIYNLIANLQERAPKLVEEVIGEKVKHSDLQKILQALLRERVPINDLETIVETLAEWSTQTRDIDVLVEYVRNGLRRSIAAQYISQDSQGKAKIYCVTIDPRLEDTVQSYIDRSSGGTTMTMPPSVANKIARTIIQELQPLILAGRPPVVLTSPQVRGPIRKLLAPHLANASVLGYNEIPQGLDVESVGLIQPPAEKDGVSAA